MSQNCSDAALYNFSPSKYSVLKCEPILGPHIWPRGGVSWFKHFKNLKRSFDVNVCTFYAVIFLSRRSFQNDLFSEFRDYPPPPLWKKALFQNVQIKPHMDTLRHVCGTGLVVLYKEEVKSKNCTKKLIDSHECLVQMS